MSGGIDSAACAHYLKSQGFCVRPIFIDYGQSAARYERQAAEALSKHLDISLTSYQVQGSPGYGSGELSGRNAFLITAAVFLSRIETGLVAIGVHEGTSYFDCSREFFEVIARLVSEQTNGRVVVVAPFQDWTRPHIMQYFKEADLPLNLTYSCEAGANPPCGLCASCCDRKSLGC
jgi:7-cyano-7-deazaguanine synthase